MKPSKFEELGPYRIVGMRIWRQMQARGLSIADLAKLCGIAPAVVRRWLIGQEQPDDTSAYILVRQWGGTRDDYREG